MLILEFCFTFCSKLWSPAINVYHNKSKNKPRGIDFNTCLALESPASLSFSVNMFSFLLELGLGGGYPTTMSSKSTCRTLVSWPLLYFSNTQMTLFYLDYYINNPPKKIMYLHLNYFIFFFTDRLFFSSLKIAIDSI